MSDDRFVVGLVLAAGSSRRLGQPKQLLPLGARTLLDCSLEVARRAPLDQRIVTVGGSAPEVVKTVDLSGFDVVDSVHHTDGCSSSIVSALPHIDDRAAGIVLLLGDMPGVTSRTIETLIATAGDHALGVCRYSDGVGHPFWLGREVFDALPGLHGDKAVWKLIDSGDFDVVEVPIDRATPLDVDTWEDYQRLVQQWQTQEDREAEASTR